MNAITTYLLPEFIAASHTGQIHSVFSHAVNIIFGETMVTIISNSDAGIPDCIVLASEDFTRLSQLDYGKHVRLEQKRIIFSDPNLSLNLNCSNCGNTFSGNCRLASPQELECRLRFVQKEFIPEHRLPDLTEAILPKLITGILREKHNQCEKKLCLLIGLGSGLTPSSDDALLGIMAVMAFYTVAKIRLMPEFPALINRLSAGRTTDVSRKYLGCAAQGRFARPLLLCVNSLLAEHAAPESTDFDLLLNTGHTSGRDMLRGILLAATAFLDLPCN